ncbi:C-X-C chemokine receptor type 4-like [Osmerus mordax]|uniref:C-X-C chemokine receptor type 4-like n=1 Tax=Osmerus mordax TaxID=8014 RepID=UPI0035103300
MGPQHIVFDYDINYTCSGDLGVALEDLCDLYQVITPDVQRRVFLPVVYGFIFVLGITGNGLMVLGCQRRSKLSLTDRSQLHLSAADLLFVLTLPFWAVDAALTDWRFGLGTCVAVHVIYTVNLYGSVLILAFISLYLAVVKATDAHTSRTRQLLARRLVFVGARLPAALLAVSDINTQLGCSLEVVLGVWLAVAEPMAFAHCCLNRLLYAFLGADFKRSARREDSTLGRVVSSLKIPPPRRPGTSTTTESESLSLHSS